MKNGHFKIERGIPMPETRGRTDRSPFTQALSTMAVGESFFIERDSQKVARHAYMWRRGNRAFEKRRFATRKEKNGCRIWRIA